MTIPEAVEATQLSFLYLHVTLQVGCAVHLCEWSLKSLRSNCLSLMLAMRACPRQVVSSSHPRGWGRKNQAWDLGHKESTGKHCNKGTAFGKGAIIGVIKGKYA